MNEAETELLAAVAAVVQAFERMGIDYLVGGSVASSVFGEPRQTLDADLLGVLKVQAGALDQEYLKDWARELRVANLLRRALDKAGLR